MFFWTAVLGTLLGLTQLVLITGASLADVELQRAACHYMRDAWASAPDVGMFVSDDSVRSAASRRSQPGARHQQRVLCAGGQRGADGAGAGPLHGCWLQAHAPRWALLRTPDPAVQPLDVCLCWRRSASCPSWF